MFNEQMILKAKARASNFVQETSRLNSIQESLLLNILANNQQCSMGKKYGFDKIHNYADFKAAVPLSVFADYQHPIERIVNGESGVLYSCENYQFVSSSGTTKKPKIIPMSQDFARQAFIPFYLTYLGQLAINYPDFLLNADKTVNFKLDPNRKMSTLDNGAQHAGLSQINFGDDFKDGALFEPGTGAVWSEVPANIDDDLERLYFRLRVSAEHGIQALIGINPAIIHSLEYLLRNWSEKLIGDLKQGTFNQQAYAPPNTDLANKLQTIANSRGYLLPKDLWPNLRYVICWKEGVSQFYIKMLNDTFGTNVTFLSAPLAASEAPVAIPLFDDQDRNLLAYDIVFYEFLDISCQSGNKIVLADGLEIDKSYAVIVTQQSGFYRYITGDLVRITGFVNGVPTLEYAGRYDENQLVSDDGLLAAVRDLAPKLTGRIKNFTFHTAKLNGCSATNIVFKVALEEGSYDGLDSFIADHLESYLMRNSHRYYQARESGRLTALAVNIVTADTFFSEWVDHVNSGKRPPQVKDKVSCD